MASRAPLPAPANESSHSVSRITQEGKKITYELNVMQQPERARACGAGAKSSADRRPVDPPPVVEMRIYESDPHDDSQKTDITFAYNANFFLFATLETARPMAQGKLAPAPSCPALTGVPVAGVAYLDRPKQAGYFIFPDLSVRHEGVYRLSFHLFEQTKDPKDATEGTPAPLPPVPGKLSAPQQFLDFRLEVVTMPFVVFSAKKFPGLKMSTQLSRIIAEQGCRVRIRRDVRMRRRGDKRTDDYDYEDDRAYSSRQSDRYATPDAYSVNPPDRPRSTSISTVDHSYAYQPQRRPSGPEYGSQNPQPYQRPIPAPAPSSTPIPPSTPSYQSHLSFGSTQTQYPVPPLSHTPQQAATSAHIYSPRTSISHGRNPSSSTEYDPSPQPYTYSHSRHTAERPSYPKPTALPPLRLPEGQHPPEHGHPRSQTPSNMALPPLKSLSGFNPAPSQPSSSIETFGHDDRPLYNGMRPDTEAYSGARRASFDPRAALFDNDDQMAYKRANGHVCIITTSPRAATDRSVDTDYNQADYQLQCSLESTCPSSNPHNNDYTPRRHEWNASRTSLESDSLSDVSGQFDDADELTSPPPEHTGIPSERLDDSPSSHSVKRRRSNDWARQSIDNDSATRKVHGFGSRPRWPFHHYGRRPGSAHGSPRSPRHGRSGRRSRFVEGHMNDTISEKPPSIFLRDAGQHPEPVRSANRQSGIFKFGKAIASAFNPFGGWGSVSEIWKGSQDGHREEEVTNDRLRQAEIAYEGLKRSGYQGTAKGSYMQSLAAANASLPEQTWESIQQKMDYGSGGGHHSRQSSTNTPVSRDSISGNSLRPSFPDLRKAKSSLGIKRSDGMSSLLQHLDSRGQEVRHQKSRKDMQRQAKLLKRVSDLEGKLDRARRELQELAGEEEILAQSYHEERPYQRKFVPGALPSLPSERLLHELEPATPLSPLAEGASQERERELASESQTQIRVEKPRLLSPKPWRKASAATPRSRSVSRKRKSPGPESRKASQTNEQLQQLSSDTSAKEDPATDPVPAPAPARAESEAIKTPLRKAKLPKTARGDSPGSVERKQKQKRSPATETASAPADDRGRISRPLRSTNPRNRSATPVLRVKKGRVDLRSTTSPGACAGLEEDKENDTQHDNGEIDGNASGARKPEQHDAQSDETPTTPASTSTPSRRMARYEYIPPVPPLPKDLAATAAKVDRRLAREMGKRRVQREKDGKATAEGFQWPEDIF
ncbi:velvet factor-domain-containing protein [Aspergillus pseudoustus]|uniref:Developmental and secondary metabolism regulator veA n=1 Tax=Aspergillus pseudoustus TaxID=1810923 RepID=A0ABR4J6M6_9EURO